MMFGLPTYIVHELRPFSPFCLTLSEGTCDARQHDPVSEMLVNQVKEQAGALIGEAMNLAPDVIQVCGCHQSDAYMYTMGEVIKGAGSHCHEWREHD